MWYVKKTFENIATNWTECNHSRKELNTVCLNKANNASSICHSGSSGDNVQWIKKGITMRYCKRLGYSSQVSTPLIMLFHVLVEYTLRHLYIHVINQKICDPSRHLRRWCIKFQITMHHHTGRWAPTISTSQSSLHIVKPCGSRLRLERITTKQRSGKKKRGRNVCFHRLTNRIATPDSKFPIGPPKRAWLMMYHQETIPKV
jgi:hypothetical protein